MNGIRRGRKQAAGGRTPSARTSGFTLLELLVVVLIAVGLILFVSALYQMVGRTAATLGSVEDEWRAEQFMRRQYLLAGTASKDHGLLEGAPDAISFVSAKSALHGEHGPPVLARYRYLPGEARLIYQERPLPPWWHGRSSPDFDVMLSDPDGWWEDTAMPQVEEVRFSFLVTGVDSNNWSDTWKNRKALPQLLRVRFERAGESREVVLETGVLSFFTPSGF